MTRVLALAAAALVSTIAFADTRFQVRHVARVTDLPAHGTVQVWVPLPISTSAQTIEELALHSDLAWDVVTEPEFGNAYAYTTVSGRSEVSLEMSFAATRRNVVFGAWADEPMSPEYRARAMRPDALVTISPRIRDISQRVTAGAPSPLQKARAIYQYVLGTMRYDKVVPGWGQGDTERACDIGTGNCTDFHSLFMSLARAAGIPTRFVMGLSLQSGGGAVGGYHCWAEFYAEGCGWIPVDISDASKSNDPAKREFLFGNLDSERIQITTGRDIRLPYASAAPLNFSFQPHAESNGRVVGCASVDVMYRRNR